MRYKFQKKNKINVIPDVIRNPFELFIEFMDSLFQGNEDVYFMKFI